MKKYIRRILQITIPYKAIDIFLKKRRMILFSSAVRLSSFEIRFLCALAVSSCRIAEVSSTCFTNSVSLAFT